MSNIANKKVIDCLTKTGTSHIYKLHLGNIIPLQADFLNRFIENTDLILISVDVNSRLGVSPKTAKSDLDNFTVKDIW